MSWDTTYDLGAFASGFESWQRVLSHSADQPAAARLDILAHAAQEVSTFIARGLDRSTAADALADMAAAVGIVDADAVQWILNNAFAASGVKLQAPARANGHDVIAPAPPAEEAVREIPIVYPFPIDAGTIPRRPWIVPGLLLRRQVTVLVAPAGSGKSLLTIQLALMCAAGRPWNAWRPRGQFRSLLINNEEDADEMRRRLFAARQAMEVDVTLLGGLAFAEAPETIVIARADARTKTVVRTPVLEQIVATVIAQQMSIVVVDPFAETFAGDENSNSELKWAAVLWREVARRTNAAVMLVHHTKKYSHDMAGDMDASRGASALNGVARIVSTLFTMTVEEAASFGLTADERVRYIRFDDAKANLSLITFAARWLRKEPVVLPNGADDEPADEIGVLQPWTPPDAFGGLTAAEVRAALTIMAAGVLDDAGKPTGDLYTVKNAGGRWVGNVLRSFRPELEDKTIRHIIGLWIRNRMVEEVDAVTSTSRGQLRKGLRVLAMPGVIEEARL